ncbi:hypothetical protein [Chitinophaga sp. XS-30]|uniref:hypothetical protein n=1 Tax=Chitinophaga sp. XS-30 TaxID=2604421 RepID=UPI0011DD14B1|nr:hypothetical protein [Chitinophaga sp. XS-30]QEH41959.1 hypothetical protein FW415_14190 [Chitinophaga sp. XS-30]
MKTRSYIYCLMAPLFLFLLSACEREGELFIKPVKAFKPVTMSGFILGDTLEQYFDGEKVRELYGRVMVPYSQSQVAFEGNEVKMELRNKSNGETVYTQTLNLQDDTSKVPPFYFDGKKIAERYNYPQPQGDEYLINFYFDFPDDAPLVDVTIEVDEIYYDFTQNPFMINLGTTVIPLLSGVKPGEWSELIRINMPEMEKHHPESFFQSGIIIRNAEKKQYYIGNNRDYSFIQASVPDMYATEGKVQCIFSGLSQQGGQLVLTPQEDLTQIFR